MPLLSRPVVGEPVRAAGQSFGMALPWEERDMNQVISQVVVGFDGSADARRALAWGIEESVSRRAALRVLISRGNRLVPNPGTRGWLAAFAEDWAGQARETLRHVGAPADVVEVTDGLPAQVLVERSDPSTLVVLGSHGHGRIAGSWLGSVSQHVARQAAGPVVVVRPAANPGSTRTVVGVDGSGGSEGALDFAFERASRTGTALFVLYGWRPAASLRMALGGPVSDRTAEETLDAERLLGESVAGLAEKYPGVEVYREAVPVPAARVLADASHNAALLVVGSRGRGAFTGMLLGSVSQAVLHDAACPVAVVR